MGYHDQNGRTMKNKNYNITIKLSVTYNGLENLPKQRVYLRSECDLGSKKNHEQ